MALEARIGDLHVRIAVSADDGGAIIWPLLAGPAPAKEYLLRGLIGTEAERINLVNHAVPTEDVLPMARKIVQELRRRPVWAVRFTKSTINIQLKQQFNMMMDALRANRSRCAAATSAKARERSLNSANQSSPMTRRCKKPAKVVAFSLAAWSAAILAFELEN
jgi:enoyl-CoA hydratase/carnithine racemase